MAKEEQGLSYADIATAMLAQANAPTRVLQAGLPGAEPRTVAPTPRGATIVAGFDGTAVHEVAQGIVLERQRAAKAAAAAKAKADAEEDKPPPEPSPRESLNAAEESLKLIGAKLDFIAKRDGIVPGSSRQAAPRGDGRKELIDRALATESERRAERKRVKTGRKLDRLLGRSAR